MSRWSDLLGTVESVFRIGLGKASLDASGLTSARTLTLPDQSGTLALTSQLAGLGGASGVITIDFGAFPGNQDVSVAVTGQTTIAATDLPRAYFKPDGVVGTHSANDHKYVQLFATLSVSTPTAGVGFTVHAVSQYQLQGQFQVQWAW
jgi:hypothetical protein